MTPQDYITLIETRFSNPEIADTTRRVAFDGSSRHAGFILPSVRDRLARGEPVDGLALVSALWARYCTGRTEAGEAVAPNDPNWTALNKVALAARTRPMAWLEQEALYGKLHQDARFADSFCCWLTALNDHGVAATIDRFCAERTA